LDITIPLDLLVPQRDLLILALAFYSLKQSHRKLNSQKAAAVTKQKSKSSAAKRIKGKVPRLVKYESNKVVMSMKQYQNKHFMEFKSLKGRRNELKF